MRSVDVTMPASSPTASGTRTECRVPSDIRSATWWTVASAVVVGRPAMLSDRGLELPLELASAFAAEEDKGRTVVAAARSGRPKPT